MMKTGDFVKLSSYGKKLVGNRSLVGSVGVITETCGDSSYYFVWWLCGDKTMATRRDLKYLRKNS